MLKKKWSLEEKIQVIQEAELNGVAPTLRKNSLASSVFYSWKAKYEDGGIEALKTKSNRLDNMELVQLKKENEQLKKMLVEKEIALNAKDELLKKTLQRRMIKS